MAFPAPYVLYHALKADAAREIEDHANSYARLLTAIRDDAYDFSSAVTHDVVTSDDIQQLAGA